MNNDLQGKVAFITGAGKGAGAQVARRLAAAGAIVAANDISPINVEALVAEINTSGGMARTFVQDMTRKLAIQAAIIDITDAYGKIDILVNAAHVAPQQGLLEMDEWDVHRLFDVNLVGAMLVMQSVGRVMSEQDGGIILNVIRREGGPPDSARRAVHAASQMGLAGLVQSAALELSPHGIKVFGLARGLGELCVARFDDFGAAALSLCSSVDLPGGALVEIGG